MLIYLLLELILYGYIYDTIYKSDSIANQNDIWRVFLFVLIKGWEMGIKIVAEYIIGETFQQDEKINMVNFNSYSHIGKSIRPWV